MFPYQTVAPTTKKIADPTLLDRVIGEHTRENLPVLYLSGPMSGIEDFNFPAFNELARKLRFLGFPVLNPADFGKDGTHRECLSRDLATLTHADIVLLLEGWESSKGAGTEIDCAIGVQIPLVRVEDLYLKILHHYFDKEELAALAALDSMRQDIAVGYDGKGRIVLGKESSIRKLALLTRILADLTGHSTDEDTDDEIDDEDDE